MSIKPLFTFLSEGLLTSAASQPSTAGVIASGTKVKGSLIKASALSSLSPEGTSLSAGQKRASCGSGNDFMKNGGAKVPDHLPIARAH